jgi:hypothetical protein
MISEAILSLRPGAQWTLNGEDYDQLNWLDEVQTKPTREEVEAELVYIRLQIERNQYQGQRYYAYPPVKDQLDMLWHAIDTGTLDKSSSFYTSLKAVKDAYPKPE